jgi:aryl-alcohol dehydrogenase-like predicted oxidoreductase
VVNYRRQQSVSSISEHFGALAELRDAGLIRHLGISGVEVEHLAEAKAIAPVVCVQNSYSLTNRSSEPVLRACAEQGVAFVPFFAIAGQGRHLGPQETDSDQLAQIAAAHGASEAQIRLAWTLHQGQHVLAIPGTGDPAHLEQNVAAAAIRLSRDEVAVLDSLQPV